MNNQSTGKLGEQIAAHFLERNEYEILERNWRFEHAEVDLICKQQNIVVFVEVKTRKGNQFGHPEQSVTEAKQKAMAKAAEEYIYVKKHTGEIRYDIISILLPKKEDAQILHLEDAFFPIS